MIMEKLCRWRSLGATVCYGIGQIGRIVSPVEKNGTRALPVYSWILCWCSRPYHMRSIIPLPIIVPKPQCLIRLATLALHEHSLSATLLFTFLRFLEHMVLSLPHEGLLLQSMYSSQCFKNHAFLGLLYCMECPSP
jgi:hypothetical protein